MAILDVLRLVAAWSLTGLTFCKGQVFSNELFAVTCSLKANFSVSNQWCLDNYGTNLASFHSKSAYYNDFANLLIDSGISNNDVWIGLHDIDSEGTFEWLDGTSVDYTNWHPGEPNNSGNEDCVASAKDSYANFTWLDNPCWADNQMCLVCSLGTRAPTTLPTAQPTIEPTMTTMDPTDTPTDEPSGRPSVSPTKMPLSPTQIYPTEMPTDMVTTITTTSTIEQEASIYDQANAIAENQQFNVLTYLLLIGLGILLLACFLSYIHSIKPFHVGCIEKVDDIQSWRVITFGFQLWDAYSDINVCYTYFKIYFTLLNSLYMWFAFLSALFILIPFITNLTYVILFLPKRLNANAKRWFIGSYDRWFLFLTLISGNAFAAIELCNSRIFGMKMFDMGLSKWEIKALRNILFFTVLFENIPQFVINITFLYYHNFTMDNVVVFSALLSSILTILTFVFGSVVRCLYQTPGIRFNIKVKILEANEVAHHSEGSSSNHKDSSNNQIEIQASSHENGFTHTSSNENNDGNVNNVQGDCDKIRKKIGFRRKIAKEIAFVLHVRREQIEIPYIIPYERGCSIECIFDCDETIDTPAKLQNSINEQLESHSLHRAFKEIFHLNSEIECIRLTTDHLEFTMEYQDDKKLDKNNLAIVRMSTKNIFKVDNRNGNKNNVTNLAALNTLNNGTTTALSDGNNNNNNNNNNNFSTQLASLPSTSQLSGSNNSNYMINPNNINGSNVGNNVNVDGNAMPFMTGIYNYSSMDSIHSMNSLNGMNNMNGMNGVYNFGYPNNMGMGMNMNQQNNMFAAQNAAMGMSQQYVGNEFEAQNNMGNIQMAGFGPNGMNGNVSSISMGANVSNDKIRQLSLHSNDDRDQSSNPWA